MDPKRRRKPGVTPLEVTFGEAFLHRPDLPLDVPVVEAPPLVLEIEDEEDDEEPSQRALRDLSRGRR